MLLVTVLAWRRVVDGSHGHGEEPDSDISELEREACK
jgi:hypothetical protein